MKKIIALVLSLILVFSSMSVVFVSASAEETTAPTNYAPSSWQAGAHWYNNGGRIIETQDSHLGGKAFTVTHGSANYQYVDAEQTITLNPNTQYRFGISVKGLTTETKGLLEALMVYKGGTKIEAGNSETFPSDKRIAYASSSIIDENLSNDSWTRLYFDFTTTDETAYDLRLRWGNISSYTLSDITLYAKANNVYEIEGNGKVVSSESNTYLGQTLSLTAVPENGEAFIGWYSGETLLSNSETYNYTILSDSTSITAKFTSNNVSLMDETKWGISARDKNASITKKDSVISVNDIQWDFFYIPMSLKTNTTYELVFDIKSQIQLERLYIVPGSCGVEHKNDGNYAGYDANVGLISKSYANTFTLANTWYENNVISFTTNSTETDYYIIVKTAAQLSGATSNTPMEFKNMYVKTLSNNYKINQNSDKFKTQGRTTVLNDLLMIDYAASGIEFNANCYGDVSVTFNSTYLPEGEGGGCYFTVIVDDKVMPRDFCHITSKGEVTLNIATDLAYGEHNFKIYRQSEMQFATIGIKSINLKGELLEAPAQNDLYIEFVGASSTNGFGNLGTADIKDQETAQLPIYQDATQAHAYLTAKALGADYSIVAWQGCGAKYSWQPMNMLTAYNYQRYLKDQTTLYDFQRQPDIVVVELSANDFTRANSLNTDSDPSNDVTEQQVIDGLVELGTLIRAKNPDAKVLWIAGSNGTNSYPLVSAAIETLGGAANNYFSLKVTSNIDGAKTHPSVEGHKVIAGEVTEFIAKNLLGNTFLTSAEVLGNGEAFASEEIAFEGDTVVYTAVADEEEYFLGWYVGETLVSTNAEYLHTFTADGNKPTAKFTTYNLMKADLWKTSPRDTNATVELNSDTVAIKEIQWNFFYIPVHLKTNTYYSFDFNYRSQIKAEKLTIYTQSCGLEYNASSGEYVPDLTNGGERILYQDSTYGTNLKNFVAADTWYNNNSVTFKTNATDTDYYIIVKTGDKLSGATATTPVEFSNAAISESLKTAVILTDEKTGRKGNAAIRAASDAEGGVAKNGLRIYNAINKQFITDNHIIEYGSIVIAANKVQNPEDLLLETENIKKGLAFRQYNTENGLAQGAILWKEDGYKNVFTSYLSGFKTENYGKEYLIRSYAISATGAVFYGDVISACIYDVVYAIDNDENANAVSINAFNVFVNNNRELYSNWCDKNGYQTGILFNKEN